MLHLLTIEPLPVKLSSQLTSFPLSGVLQTGLTHPSGKQTRGQFLLFAEQTEFLLLPFAPPSVSFELRKDSSPRCVFLLSPTSFSGTMREMLWK